MKKKAFFFFGILLSGWLGWVLAYLRLPALQQKHSFYIGFIAGLVLFAFALLLFFIWNKKQVLVSLVGKKTNGLSLIMLLPVFIILVLLASSIIVYKKNKALNRQAIEQKEKIKELSGIIESVRKSHQTYLLSNLLNKIDTEINNDEGKLSDNTIERIISFSFSVKPYSYVTEGGLSEKKLSPERAQLLLALFSMDIDSTTFEKIKLDATFAKADLNNSILKGKRFSGMNLEGASFVDADLQGAVFVETNLKRANFWGANLSGATMSKAELESSNLSWANLIEAQLDSADLNGADLSNVKLVRANLHKATFKYSIMDGAMLNDADLSMADLFSASLVKANLSGVSLDRARLRKAKLTEVSLISASFSKIAVEEDWLDAAKVYKIEGAKEFFENHSVVEDTSLLFSKDKYYLKQVE